jgi:hypothetical protein
MKMERDVLQKHGLKSLCVLLAAFISAGSVDANAQDSTTKKPAVEKPATQKPAVGEEAGRKQNKEKSLSVGAEPASSANLLDGMIDGDAPSAVPDSIIPKVLSASERQKLGITQGRFALPALAAASTALPDGEGDGDRYPETFVQQFGEFTEPLPESGSQRSADWHWSWCYWSAANTFSNPLYFEDRMLERHGQECVGCLQPFASGARFFGAVPMLPYLWTVSNPCDCGYTLGHYPAGQCVPIMMQRPPYENRAAVVEAGAAAALIIGFP